MGLFYDDCRSRHSLGDEPVVAFYDRLGVALGLFYASAVDIPLLSPVPTGGGLVLVLEVCFTTPVCAAVAFGRLSQGDEYSIRSIRYAR